MRLYMSRQEKETLDACFALHNKFLNEEGISAEDKRRSEEQIALITGTLLSPLLPIGLVRKVLMFGFFALGVLAFLTPYEWLFWSFFIGLTFSPRIVGELAIRLGRRNSND